MTDSNSRIADHPIDRIFLDRWSPRALTGEAIDPATLLTILEAGRWAPSSYNSQPWRFVYALRGDPNWATFVELLSPFNRSWAQDASALLVIVSNPTFVRPDTKEEIVSQSASFDTGAAWAYLALQASLLGWVAHGIAGFDIDQAHKVLRVPAGHRIETAVAIGRKGDKSKLPVALAQREAPNGRLQLAELVAAGGF